MLRQRSESSGDYHFSLCVQQPLSDQVLFVVVQNAVGVAFEIQGENGKGPDNPSEIIHQCVIRDDGTGTHCASVSNGVFLYC